MHHQEKEKELEIKNIYANRVMRPPHKLNSSVSSTPIPEAPPRRARKRSEPGITPREKMKLYEDKRREDQKRVDQERQEVITTDTLITLHMYILIDIASKFSFNIVTMQALLFCAEPSSHKYKD